MNNAVSIVEGDGEVAALPILLRRLGQWLSPNNYISVQNPIRVRRDRFLNKDHEFRRMLMLAGAKAGEDGWVLVLLDADDDCPAELSARILDRASAVIPDRHVSIVLANREYEAWFIAAAQSLNGKRGFQCNEAITDPEIPRNAKGWLERHMIGNTYREATDQPAFSALMDLAQAKERSRSFQKLCSEFEKHFVTGNPTTR